MSIEVVNISKSYGDQKALDQISFSIKKGEIVGFLGPNGAGKSTLMKILTTYLSAEEGTGKVNGFDIQTETKSVQKSVGYLPEHNPLYLDLYVREYLSFNADVYHVSKKRIDEVIILTGLTPESDKKISQLSKGYRQRVGLACALLHDPEVLILDEPTTGLDPNQLVEIRALIKNIGKDKTVFLSTHIMQEVEAICERVIIINQGKIVEDKNLKHLVKEQLHQTVSIEFDQMLQKEDFAIFTNLIQLVVVTPTSFELTFESETDMRPLLFDFAKEKELKILQLSLKNKNLEQIFREKTSNNKTV
ncbi:gliding motility-associated ABC transporter ATP-binding subunit GldA [Flavobacterium sp. NRK F7]|uniref:gliding motility-associated ABC transporter ATP-binding subunit GldA n=1 Tax=Flavobacterium sp. NRK F7 TaxID=2954930 RepID=UPI002090E3B1|nr:gliding motility-associated ABC transporter ATP-binding subunit GldA [Flavobacterium sp. NRK F7]MCO6161276.1 gliding motility-associated ABC transporter ATP-binding subunit GldA [Flavobacterium sp. NRK F7]